MSTLDNIIPSVVGSSLGVLTSPLTSKIASDNQKDLMDYQNKLQEANWDKHFREQNAQQQRLLINSPAMQVQGYKNAGLNPALLSGRFGDVSSIPSNPSQGVSIPSPSVNISDMVRVGQMAAQLYNESKLADAQARLMNSDSALKETDLGTRSDINNATLQNLLTQNVLDKSQIDKVVSETDVNRQNYMYLLNTFDERVKSVTLQNQSTAQEFEKLQADTRFITNQNLWMPRLWQSEINLQVAQGNLARSEARRAQSQINEIEYTYNELLPAQKRQADMYADNLWIQYYKTKSEASEAKSNAEIARLRKESYASVDPKVRAYLELTTDVIGSVGNIVSAGGIGFGGITQGIKNLKSVRNQNRPFQE